MRQSTGTKAERTALTGVMVALAMILSYVESLIVLPVGIPGVKVGLANLVVFFALYRLSAREAFGISIVRILLVSATFGNASAFLYSLAGGLLSFLVMWLCKKSGFLLPVGVSIAGGISHNIGQLLMSAIVLENAAVFSYFPALLTAGCVTGALIGVVGGLVNKRIDRK